MSDRELQDRDHGSNYKKPYTRRVYDSSEPRVSASKTYCTPDSPRVLSSLAGSSQRMPAESKYDVNYFQGGLELGSFFGGAGQTRRLRGDKQKRSITDTSNTMLSLRSDNEDKRVLEQKIQTLKNQLRELEIEREIHQNREIKLRDEIDRYDHRLRNAVEALERNEVITEPQEDDESLSGRFFDLYRKVHSWSKAFLTDNVPDKALYPEFESSIRALAPPGLDFELLEQKSSRRLVVQGIISYRLVAVVFENTPLNLGYHSGLNVRESFNGIKESLKTMHYEADLVSVEELNDWRALTVTLVMRAMVSKTRTAAKKSLPLEELENLVQTLRPLVKEESNLGKLEGNLRAIFVEAIILSGTLYKQRAEWCVKFPNSEPQLPASTVSVPSDTHIGDKLRIEFSSDLMEDVKDDSEDDILAIGGMEKEVRMFIFPGLFKRGDSSGCNYDIESCISKAKVICHSR